MKYYSLGVDPSLNGSGLSILEYDTTTNRTVVVSTTRIKNRSGGPIGPKLVHIYNSTQGFLATCANKPDIVIMEGPSFGSIGDHHALGQVAGIFELVLVQAGYSTKVVAPKKIRKLVFGAGDISKQAAKKFLETFLGGSVSFASLDESDATGIALLGVKYLILTNKLPGHTRLSTDIEKALK